MRPVSKTIFLALLLSGAFKLLAVPASELKENYQPIVDRNPFGLKPPPPPPTNNPTANQKEKPKTEIFLTGITSVGYPRVPKQVYLMTKEQNKKEPTYYTLTEGIEKDGIKVLNIDDTGRKVRIHTPDEGEVMLSFQTHGVAPPVSAAPKPGAPGQPGQPMPGQPGFPAPQPSTAPQPINNPTAYPTAPTGGATAVPGVTTPSPIRQIPSRRVRAGMDGTGGAMNSGVGGPLPNAGVPMQQEIDPAEQYVRMHLNRAAAEKQGIPQPPLPIIGQ